MTHMLSSTRFNWASILSVALALALTGCGKAKSANPGAGSIAMIVSNKLAAITAAGDPVTLEELNAMYVEPPAAENAAGIYEQAFSALTADDPNAPAFLARNQKALALLLQAAERKSCRYPVQLTDGVATKLSHLPKIKKCALLLQSETVNQAALGRTDASTKAVLAGVSLARSLENEPITMSWLVEVSSLSVTFQGLEQALTRKAFAADQLLTLQAALKDAESAASFRRAMVGERASGISYFRMSPEKLAALSGTNSAQRTGMAAYLKSPTFQQDFDFALDCLSNQIAVAEMPFPQSLDASAQGAPNLETAISRGFVLSLLLLPTLDGLVNKSADAAARIRITQTALAIERYRLGHANALPGSLAELSPELLEAVPSDPFDGQPLRYQKLPTKGYKVYSIGKDRKDDQGASKAADGKSSSPPDITFTVQR
jgi:hypothetical protein